MTEKRNLVHSYSAEASPPAPEDAPFTKRRIIKNLLTISFSWWLLFSAYDCLLILQSTLNSEEGKGVISVAILHAGGCIVAATLPKYAIKSLGCRLVTIFSMLLHIPFIATNFYPHWTVMIPSAILVSVGNPLLWTSMDNYVTELSFMYTSCVQNEVSEQQGSIEAPRHNSSEPKDGGPEKDIEQKIMYEKLLGGIVPRFFGVHALIYQFCHCSGNLLAYFILSNDVEPERRSNSTCSCGSGFCPDQRVCVDSNFKEPSVEIRYTLTGTCVALALVSVFIIACFLDEVKKREKVAPSWEIFTASFKLFKRRNFFLLVPITVYIGILQGFAIGDYTQAFVGCAWGIPNIPLIMVVFGASLCLSSALSGWLVKYFGRPPIFLFATVLNALLAVYLLLWRPNGDSPTMLFAVAGFFGFLIGAFGSQNRAFYGILFKEDGEAAFGNNQLFFNVGSLIAFGYSKYLCTSVKIYLLLIFLGPAILGYTIVEYSYSKFK